MKMEKRKEYIAPGADVLICRCESMICQSKASTEQYVEGSVVTDMFTTDVFE